MPVLGANVTVADGVPVASKPGVGSPSSAVAVVASAPMPLRAKASHISFWLAPPKRIWSAASIASRASSMLVAPCWSRKESNISCTQRRLPGHWSAGSGELVAVPCAQRSWSDLSLDGKAPFHLSTRAWRTSHWVRVPDLAVGVHLGPVLSKP